jgi:hypothetical protein
MTGPDDRTRRIQNYLDGYLTPDQEIGVRRQISEDEGWRREHDALRAVYTLLDTPLDLDPPEDLAPGVLAAIRADELEQAEASRLPARVEGGLVLAGATALATALVVLLRVLTPESVLGGLAVRSASALSLAPDGIVRSIDAVLHLDWVSRTLATLADAGRTTLSVAAEPLLGVALVSAVITLGMGWLVLRGGAGGSPGGLSHG